MIDNVHAELDRLAAREILVTQDDEFAPDAGELLRVEIKAAYWHVLPERFLAMLKELPDRAGPDEVHQQLERTGLAVWHGPSPEDSRDHLL